MKFVKESVIWAIITMTLMWGSFVLGKESTKDTAQYLYECAMDLNECEDQRQTMAGKCVEVCERCEIEQDSALHRCLDMLPNKNTAKQLWGTLGGEQR